MPTKPPYDAYVHYLSQPLMKTTCLFEGGVGRNINGNMFALVRMMCTDSAYADYELVYSVREELLAVARERFASYGLDRVHFVISESDEYNRYLARAKYLWNDNTFPAYFTKREGQVYVNTWHGSGPKLLGMPDIQNSLRTFANVQKNLLAADYEVYPSEVTRGAYLRNYELAPFYSGTCLMHDYPRNDVFDDRGLYERVRTEQGIGTEQQVIAYMPTWRGAGRTAEGEEQVEIISRQLALIDARLRDGQLFFVNLHFLVSSQLSYDDYRHIRPFPRELETYDFLAACDVLVSDYSSVMFDYAVTGRPILLFAYDEEEYLCDKKLFFPYREMPFPIANTAEELTDLLTGDLSGVTYPEFQQRFCAYHTGHATKDLLDLVFFGQSKGVNAIPCTHAPIDTALYVNNLGKKGKTDALVREVLARVDEHTALITTATFSEGTIEAFRQLDGRIPLFVIVRRHVQTREEERLFELAQRNKFFNRLFEWRLRSYFAREAHQMLGDFHPRQICCLEPDGSYFMWMAKGLDCERRAITGLIKSGKKTREAAAVCLAQGYTAEKGSPSSDT